MAEVAKKGKVGRPRTSEPNKIVPKEGIVTIPQNFDEKFEQNVNIMEMLYDNPKIIAKLFVLIDELCTEPLYMFFQTTMVEIHFKSGENDVYIAMKGSEMNRYYIAEPFCIKIEGGTTFKNLADTTKNFNSVKFNINSKDLQQVKKSMRVILVYDRKDAEDISSIPIITCDRNSTKMPSYIKPSINRLDSYPLKFEFDPVHLKMCVTSRILQESDRVRIIKGEDSVLTYDFLKGIDIVEHTTQLKNPVKINLICDHEPDDTMVFVLDREFVRRVTNKIISKHGLVYLSNDLRFCFSYFLDPEILDVKNGNKTDKIPVYGTEKISIYILVQNNSDTQKYLDTVAEANS